MTAGADRPDTAARYARDVRLGLELLGDGRPRGGGFRVALYRAAIGVLRYSELDEDLEVASKAIARLVGDRERALIDTVTVELRAAGATIAPDVVDRAAWARAERKLVGELEGLGIDLERFRP